MQFKRPVLLVSIALWGAPAQADWLWKPRTRPGCLTGIPARDYQHRSVSASERMISQRAVLVEIPAATRDATLSESTARSQHRIKVFQMSEPNLVIEHCGIFEVVFQVRDDGLCTLNLVAKQGIDPPEPSKPEAPLTAAAEGIPQTGHIKRNEFHVNVRGFALYRDEETRDVPRLGKPVVLQMEPLSFWVQRGRDYVGVFDDFSCDARDNFDLLDRVEIEFAYSTLRGEEH
jgi:hypothetical protein